MKSLGQIAYEAYAAQILKDASYVVAGWEQSSELTKAAWEASADAITAALLKKPAEFAQ